MTEIEFIKKIALDNPTYDYLTKYGDSESLAYMNRQKNVIKRKEDSIFIDPLLRLIDMYDYSTEYLTNLDFNQEVLEKFGGLYLGHLEGDFLIMYKNTFEIVVVNYYNPKQIIYHCAKNGYNFLDALFISLTSGIPEDDETLRTKHRILTATICAEAAGGNIYKNFWMEV